MMTPHSGGTRRCGLCKWRKERKFQPMTIRSCSPILRLSCLVPTFITVYIEKIYFAISDKNKLPCEIEARLHSRGPGIS
jgi:hypothetical protein